MTKVSHAASRVINIIFPICLVFFFVLHFINFFKKVLLYSNIISLMIQKIDTMSKKKHNENQQMPDIWDIHQLSQTLKKLLRFFSIENWLGYFKMSNFLILGGWKADKLKKTQWVMFCGTPCTIAICWPSLWCNDLPKQNQGYRPPEENRQIIAEVPYKVIQNISASPGSSSSCILYFPL